MSFDAVMGRLKAALELKTDAALYELFGISSGDYANRKRRGSIPFQQIIALSLSRNVSINWLFSGSGPTFLDGRTVVAPGLIDHDLENEVVGEFYRACLDGGMTKLEASDVESMRAYIRTIYNSVAFEADKVARKEKIKAKAEEFAPIFRKHHYDPPLQRG